MPAWVEVRQIPGEGSLDAKSMINTLGLPAGSLLLTEGGPHLLGSLLKGHQLHELFLTLAPQVAGKDTQHPRSGLIEGQLFAPEDPRWAELIGIKKGESHLFLRYGFRPLD